MLSIIYVWFLFFSSDKAELFYNVPYNYTKSLKRKLRGLKPLLAHFISMIIL